MKPLLFIYCYYAKQIICKTACNSSIKSNASDALPGYPYVNPTYGSNPTVSRADAYIPASIEYAKEKVHSILSKGGLLVQPLN